MTTHEIHIPADGERIAINADLSLSVPDNPIIPYIEGDGIGVDVFPVMRHVVDAAVERAYGDRRGLAWMEVFAGEKSVKLYGGETWLPEETLQAMRDYVVAIKGPLTTPVGGGMRSLNVAIRQVLDLYACIRPIRYFPGTPSPLKDSDATDMVVFRENTEDIYAGVEWPADSAEAIEVIEFLQQKMGVTNIRFPDHCGIGVKPVSRAGSQRLVRKAIRYALDHDRESVTLVHKGNIMKYTEGAFRNWGYQVAQEEFGAQVVGDGPWCRVAKPGGGTLIIKDVIADNFLQQILLRPEDYDVIATLNLNGDYISDALAAQVGGIGIAPGGNVGDGFAVFEATHGTAPKYAGRNRVNPGSMILSGEMMLRYLGWAEAADLVTKGVAGAIGAGQVTYDLARARTAFRDRGVVRESGEKTARKVSEEVERLLPGATLVTCSGFGDAVIAHM